MDTTGKSALKLADLLNMKVVCQRRGKILLCKVPRFCRRLYGGGTNLLPIIQTSVKSRDFVDAYPR